MRKTAESAVFLTSYLFALVELYVNSYMSPSDRSVSNR